MLQTIHDSILASQETTLVLMIQNNDCPLNGWGIYTSSFTKPQLKRVPKLPYKNLHLMYITLTIKCSEQKQPSSRQHLSFKNSASCNCSPFYDKAKHKKFPLINLAFLSLVE